MAEYKINMLDEAPPREWSGPKGKVYYITVGLEGHDKPVSIGKKAPDALKVGDVVYGEIEPTDYITDKWKHGETPQIAASSSIEERGQGITASMAVKLAYHAFIQTESMLPRDSVHWADVKEQARQIYLAVEEIKNSGSQSGGGISTDNSPKATNEPKSPAAADPQSVKDKVKKWERDPPSRELSPDEANEFLGGLDE